MAYRETFFHGFKLHQVEDLSWYFWLREAFTTVNVMTKKLTTEPDQVFSKKVLVLLPLVHVFFTPYMAWQLRRHVLSICSHFVILNQRNVEYLTVLAKISGVGIYVEEYNDDVGYGVEE